MADQQAGFVETLDAPPNDAAVVTPHDTNPLGFVTRCIWVGVTGDVSVTMAGGQTLTYPNVTAGMWHPMRATHIRVTGTTASGGILAGW